MDKESLSVAEMLMALREDIQAENTLIASRVTWYVTSQAFLLTAYATSWSDSFRWQAFFHHVVPLAALVLSAVIFASIYAATWAQDVYLREQQSLVFQLKSKFQLSDSEKIAIEVYERTMVANRQNPAGRVIGGQISSTIRAVWRNRTDRYSEIRGAIPEYLATPIARNRPEMSYIGG